MKKIAFIFPGQGSQSVGMGKELAAMYPPAQQTFDEADEALGYKISELCFNGPEKKLKLTEITQPAILGMSAEKVQQVCAEAAQGQVVDPANNNSPEQIVISGHAAAVQRAADLARQRGAKKAIMLQVSAPFHCSLLKPAQHRLEQDLSQIEFHNLEIPLIANVDAEPKTQAREARDALVRQATGAVQWERSMRKLIQLGVETFVEVGPGKVLCGLMRQIDRSKTCVNVQDETSLQNAVNHLEEHRSAMH